MRTRSFVESIRFCIFLSIAFWPGLFALGQIGPDVENGYKPYGSYDDGHIDSVNTLNGNLILDIPAPFNYPQRGSLKPRYVFYLSSKNWTVQCVSNTGSPTGEYCQWEPAIASQCVTPFTNVNSAFTAQVCAFPTGVYLTNTLDLTVRRTAEKDLTGTDNVVYDAFGYSITSWDLAVHELYPVPGTADSTGEATQFESVDGTGYRMQMSGPGSGGVMNNVLIIDRAGNQYQGTFPDASTCLSGPLNAFGGVPPDSTPAGTYMPIANGNYGDFFCGQFATFNTVTDTNGNVYNLASGTDTLGRTLPEMATTSSTAGCVSPLSISNVSTFSYLAPNGTTNQLIFCYSNFPVSTNFSQPSQTSQAQGPQNPGLATTTSLNLVATIILPTGAKWTFNYDGYGEVTNVGLPLGGSVSYTWTEIDSFGNCGEFTPVSRAVSSRTVTDGNGNSFVWKYQWGVPSGNTLSNTVTDPLNNDTVHVFTALDSVGYQACSFYETETQTYQGSGGSRHLLEKVDTTYSSGALNIDDSSAAGLGNVFATNIQTTIYPTGKIRSIQRTSDPGMGSKAPIFGDVATEKELDWGSQAPGGAVLRETDSTYAWQANNSYLSANILDPPSSVVTKDGNGNRMAETDYTYDESQYLTWANVETQHGTAPNPVRGNLSTVSKWLNTSNPVVSHTNWYDTGEVYQAIDPLGHTTTHSYDPAYAGAYSTKTTSPLGQTVSGTYDFNTGLLTSLTDANASYQASGNTPGDPAHTSNYTYDSMSRMTLTQLPADPSGSRPQTTFTYSPGNSFPFNVQRQKSITAGLTDSLTTYFDGLGRPYEAQHATPNGNATVVTTYDALDHPISVTNPYFSTSDPTYGVTQTQYDALGRVTQVTKQDGSVSTVAYEVSVPSGVTGDCTVSTDEAGNPRRTCSDGLGRLIEVDEPGDPIVNFNGAAAPATAVYAMTGFSDSYGEHDLYVGTDQHIYQLYQTGYGWVNQDLTTMTGGGLAASHSAMTNFSDGNGDHIVYVGANQHIYQMLFTGSSGWQNQDLNALTGNTLAVTTAGLSSFVDSYGSHVLYIGTNQHVYQLYWSGSWQNQDLSAQTGNSLALTTTGFTTFTDSYGEHAVYEGANQHVYQLYFANGWVNQDLTSMTGNTLAASPTAFSSMTDSYGVHVFYFASNQHLNQLYSGWVNQDLSAMTGNTLAANGSSLSSFGDYMGEHVFYLGTNQHLYQMFFSGSAGWQNQDLTAMTLSPGATSGGGSAAYDDGSGEHVFYDGGGQGVYELSWDGGAWRFSNVGGPSLAENYYITQYSYDALGNLLTVTQKGDPSVNNSSQYRARTFTYDSLSRLLTATNPESGQISYSYDADGNVLQKTSPLANQTGTATQTVSYCYDAVNRVTGKAYTAQSCPLSSPVVTYSYDSGTNGIGHLTGLSDQAGSGSYSYDALGRIGTEQRSIAGNGKTLSYTYNLDNSVATLTYPSGAVVTYTPWNNGTVATGAPSKAVDSGNNINYITSGNYGPDGSLTTFVSGNSSGFSGITSSWQYNPRLQTCRITALSTGSVPTSCTDSSHTGNVLDLGYNMNLGSGDNGNVASITNYKDSTRSQSFTYDALNRLTSAQNAGTNCNQTTVNGKTEYWGNSYGYDPWGNLLQKNPTRCSPENLSVTALSNNQLSGYGYDAAGNMTHDASTGSTYTFDQENRITGAAGYTYTYDADGNRVEKSNGSTGTVYWYMSPGIVAESDLSGNLKSEYVFFGGERVARKDFSGGTTSVAYYFSDRLKTASVITNSAGAITEDEDYYPWGGELQFVNSDSNHYKFTSKERDTETGLDYFGARYYGNWLGRWMSPDWAAKPEAVPYSDLHDPQSLNLYGYVRNVPTSRADPDGHDGPWPTSALLGPIFNPVDLGDRAWNAVKDLGHDIGSFLNPGVKQNYEIHQQLCPCNSGVYDVGNRSAEDSKKSNNSQSQNASGKQGGSAQGQGRAGQGGRAPSKIDRKAFKAEREAFWKNEAKEHPENYSAENLERMQKGRPPVGPDGHPVELHHVDRTQDGGVKPMTRTDHRLGENYKKNHPD